MKILFLINSKKSPPARFRLWQFVDPIQKAGHSVTARLMCPPRDWTINISIGFVRNIITKLGSFLRLLSVIWITRDIGEFDVVMFNRDLLPGNRFSMLEPWLSKRNPRLIFDFDDAIHLGPRHDKLKKILPSCALISAGNQYLADYAKQYNNNVKIWPTVVNTEHYQPAIDRTEGPIRIGWSGSRSTVQYCLPLLENVIRKLAETEKFEFIVIADVNPHIDWDGVMHRFIPWTPESEVWGLQQIDIGLMPLLDEPFERGKCGLKAIQYMAVGVPALVSPVGVNKEIVLHGKTGFHCQTDHEWLEFLQILIHDEELRKIMGRASRERVIENFSINSLLPAMLDCFFEVAAMKDANC